jgi:hypothetical protein
LGVARSLESWRMSPHLMRMLIAIATAMAIVTLIWMVTPMETRTALVTLTETLTEKAILIEPRTPTFPSTVATGTQMPTWISLTPGTLTLTGDADGDADADLDEAADADTDPDEDVDLFRPL